MDGSFWGKFRSKVDGLYGDMDVDTGSGGVGIDFIGFAGN